MRGLIPFGLILLLIGALTFIMYFPPKSDETPLDYKQKYDSIQQLHTQESLERLVFIRTIDSITSDNKLLRTELLDLNQELKSIPGRYDDRTPSELEIEMERRANGN
jgi:hypothetical protein